MFELKNLKAVLQELRNSIHMIAVTVLSRQRHQEVILLLTLHRHPTDIRQTLQSKAAPVHQQNPILIRKLPKILQETRLVQYIQMFLVEL